jgi:hypothetical protein
MREHHRGVSGGLGWAGLSRIHRRSLIDGGRLRVGIPWGGRRLLIVGDAPLEIRDPCARREKVLGRVARRNSRRTGRVERPAERLFLDSGSDIKFPFPEDYVIGIFQGALGVVFTLERDKAVALRYSGSVLDYLGGLYCTVATEKLEEFAFGGVGRNATDEDPVWNKGTCKGSLLFEESRRDARGLTVFGGVVVGGRWGALGDRLRISIRHRSAGWSVDG